MVVDNQTERNKMFKKLDLTQEEYQELSKTKDKENYVMNRYPLEKLNLAVEEYSCKKTEQVMVFPSALIKNNNYFEGIVVGKALNEIVNNIFNNNVLYIERHIAEKDRNYKQIIPYCIFTKDDSVFVYERSNSGSETRLHKMFSIGVGGHINPCDGANSEALIIACKREIMEEVNFSTDENMFPIALINDDSDEVGSVHFGIVYHIKLNENSIFTPIDKSILNGTFKNINELASDQSKLEKWTKLVLSLLI